MVTITGEYHGDLHCTATHGPSGAVLATDAPRDNQGRGEAFSPTDLVATALATCVATTLAIAARKYGIDLKGLRYEVTKEMSPQPPRRIAVLGLKLWLPPAARGLPAGFVETVAHGCPVHRSLVPEVEKKLELAWLPEPN
jgi:putative redox protein